MSRVIIVRSLQKVNVCVVSSSASVCLSVLFIFATTELMQIKFRIRILVCLCDGLITHPEESYSLSNCMCDHGNSERGPMFQLGTCRKINE
jgi:hypothetical protein